MGPENDGVEHELLEIVRDVRALALTERMRGVAAVCSNQDGMKDKPADQVAAEDSADSHTPGVEEAAVDSTSAEEKVEHERRATHSSGSSLAWHQVASGARDGRFKSLKAVREEMGDCQRCTLCKSRRNIVFGAGSERADLVIVGEAPGYHEDQSGDPFVGAAGQMLDRMLENVLGLGRADTYIVNVVKCRPPKNRNPLPDEVEACRPFLEAQIDAIQPKLVLVLGTVALKTLFGTQDGITRNRGIWKEWRGVPVMPTFHPAYLLRNGRDKRMTFEDLKALKARYDQLGGRRG